MSLGIIAYDEAEKRAKTRLGFQEIRAFASIAMDITGFPTRVDTERQIAAYMDWNDGHHSNVLFTESFVPVRALEMRFTSEEIGLARIASDRAAAVVQALCARAMRPIGGLVAMFGLLRIVKAMKAISGLPQVTVFEVGPGNGFLGALLALSGDRYFSIDNAQALYLWQSRLLEACAPGEFFEWTGKGRPATDFRIQHLPWWDYLAFRHGNMPKVDIFISNCNLSEMNYDGLKVTSRLAARMVQGSPIGRFLYISTGNPTNNTPEVIEQELSQSGFVKHTSRLFHSFGLESSTADRFAVLDSGIPLVGDSAKTVDFAGFLKGTGLTRESLPFDLEFVRFLGYQNHYADHPAFQAFI